MKKSLIALAVAATAATPMTASAARLQGAGDQEGIDIYGSFRPQFQVIKSKTNNDEAYSDITDGGSRWGIQGSHDLGNGLSAFYRLERGFSTQDANFPEQGRLAYAGLRGSFGALSLGNQWSPYYNTIGSPSDLFAGAGLQQYNSDGPFRLDQTLIYELPDGLPVNGAIAISVGEGEANAAYEELVRAAAAASKNADDAAADRALLWTLNTEIGAKKIMVDTALMNAKDRDEDDPDRDTAIANAEADVAQVEQLIIKLDGSRAAAAAAKETAKEAAAKAAAADTDALRELSVAFSFNPGPLTIGLGYHNIEGAEDNSRAGLSLGADIGPVAATFMIEDVEIGDVDTNPWAITASLRGFDIQYSDNDAENDTTAITLGYTHNLSANTRLQFAWESKSVDNPTATEDDVDTFVARYRVDF